MSNLDNDVSYNYLKTTSTLTSYCGVASNASDYRPKGYDFKTRCRQFGFSFFLYCHLKHWCALFRHSMLNLYKSFKYYAEIYEYLIHRNKLTGIILILYISHGFLIVYPYHYLLLKHVERKPFVYNKDMQ